MKKSFFVLTLLIGFSALIINSCSKSDSTPAASTPPPVAGTWQRSAGISILSLTLNNDYSYSLLVTGTTYESGTFTIAAPIITFNSSSTSVSGCSGKPGKYTYVISTVGGATVLTLTSPSDSCTIRANYAAGPWNKQ